MIGARGENINRIRKDSGCSVELDESDPRMGYLIMRGSDKAIAKAKALIEECMVEFENPLGEKRPAQKRRGGSDSWSVDRRRRAAAANDRARDARRADRVVEVQIAVPMEHVGYMVGKGGETINRLKRESGAYLGFDQPKNRHTPANLVIRGTQDQVDKANELALELLDHAENRTGAGKSAMLAAQLPSGHVRDSVVIAKEHVSRFIGTRGETVSRLRAESNCAIELDETNPDNPKLLLMGEVGVVKRAMALIEDLAMQFERSEGMEDAPPLVMPSMSPMAMKGKGLPPGMPPMPFMPLGKGGKGMGPVEDWMQLPPQVRGAVIGPKGSNIRNIETQSGASLDFKDDHLLVIKGDPEAVFRARHMVEMTLAGTREGGMMPMPPNGMGDDGFGWGPPPPPMNEMDIERQQMLADLDDEGAGAVAADGDMIDPEDI